MKFKDYIRGSRYGKNANKLERKAMNDPFLQDAIDGYDAVESDFSKDLEELEKRIRKKTNADLKPTFSYKRFFSIAAIVLLLVLGLGGLFYFISSDKDDTTPVLAQKDAITQHDDIAVLNEKSAAASSDKDDALSDLAQEDAVTQHNGVAILDEKNVVASSKFVAEMNDAIPATAQAEEKLPEKIESVFAQANIDKVVESEVMNTEIIAREAEQEIAPPPFCINTISGVVADRDTNEPIAFAEIAFFSGERMIVDAYTDFNGKYSMANIPDISSGKIQISALGYATETITVSKENLADLGGNAYQLKIALKNSSSENVVAAADQQQQLMYRKEAALSETESRTIVSSFGTQEFLHYFEENRKQDICNGAKAEVTVSFVVNAQGRPERIFIKKNDCDALRQEVIRLLGKSPQWTLQKGVVELNIQIN